MKPHAFLSQAWFSTHPSGMGVNGGNQYLKLGKHAYIQLFNY